MNRETLLLRQVHPSFVQNGRVSSQAFRPTPKDESRLSVYDGDRIAPGPAWDHYTLVQGLQSVGVLAVSVGECEALALKAESDPAPFPEHVVIDFSGLSKGQIEKAAKQLRSRAEARDWLFRAAS